MLKKWIENLTFTASNDDQDARRKYQRRYMDSAIATLGKDSFAIEDWSEGGLLVNADDKLFGIDQPLNMVLKFKLPNKMIMMEQAGRIVRKAHNKIGIQFDQLDTDNARKFRQIIESSVTRDFVDSQIAL